MKYGSFVEKRESSDSCYARVYSCAVVGLEGVMVEVEVDVGHGRARDRDRWVSG